MSLVALFPFFPRVFGRPHFGDEVVVVVAIGESVVVVMIVGRTFFLPSIFTCPGEGVLVKGSSKTDTSQIVAFVRWRKEWHEWYSESGTVKI